MHSLSFSSMHLFALLAHSLLCSALLSSALLLSPALHHQHLPMPPRPPKLTPHTHTCSAGKLGLTDEQAKMIENMKTADEDDQVDTKASSDSLGADEVHVSTLDLK